MTNVEAEPDGLMITSIERTVENDAYLIARFHAGESEAFDRLMSLHVDRVYRVAWQALHDHEEAMDAAQEVFIRLHAALPKMGEVANLSAWLYRVCLNHCIDRKRRPSRSDVQFTDEDWAALRGPDELDPARSVQQSELARVIRSAVDELPRQQRATFLLRHYEQLSLNEIAEVLGCSTGAVKCHLSRATASMRNKLRPYTGRAAEEMK